MLSATSKTDCRKSLSGRRFRREKLEIRAYAKQAGEGLEAQNILAEIKIRAERRAGELIAEEFPHGGDRRSESSLDAQRLKDVGISWFQSHRWQDIAAPS